MKIIQKDIENEIRKSITNHLVRHIRVTENDKRCRIDILVEEAAQKIMNLINEYNINPKNFEL